MLNLYDLNKVDTTWRDGRIPKKTPGEFRDIKIPNDALKDVQKDVLDYLYALIRAGTIKVSACAHGFIPYRGCMTSIVKHSRTPRCWVSCDVKSFFDNCPPSMAAAKMLDGYVAKPYVDGIMRVCVCDGKIPQGGPASPMLTNIAMFDADNMIASYAQEHGFVYTRYADDMLFTLEHVSDEMEEMLQKTHESHSKNPFVWFLMGVETIIKNTLGLELNHMKDRCVFRGAPHSSPRQLGIVIRQDGKGYNASRRYRQNTRAAVCNLYHKVFMVQGGEIQYDDWKQWAKVVGCIRYMNSCRARSDEGFDGNDPVIQDKYFKPLEIHFDAARQLQSTAKQST